MRVIAPRLIILTLCTAAGAAQAQVTQTKKVLTLEGAKTVAAAAALEAKKGNEGASIAIVDDGGNLIYLERIQPTFAMGTTISTEKARTAALFQKPTKVLEDAIVAGRTPLLNAWSAPTGALRSAADTARLSPLYVSITTRGEPGTNRFSTVSNAWYDLRPHNRVVVPAPSQPGIYFLEYGVYALDQLNTKYPPLYRRVCRFTVR
jgi:uncharacterized protein GlcG (DUF336 family)